MENNWGSPVILGNGTRNLILGTLEIDIIDECARVKEQLEFGEAEGIQSSVQGVSQAAFQHGIPPSSTVIGIKVEILKNDMVMHEIQTEVKDKQTAIDGTNKAIKKGQQCFVGFVNQNLFKIVFGSVDPRQTIRVTFEYLVSLGPSMELRLPLSFQPKFLSNPGNADQNKAITGRMTFTVKCPEYIDSITDMRTNSMLELSNVSEEAAVRSFSQTEDGELNLHLKFNTKKQSNNSTRVSVFQFSDKVGGNSELSGKFGVVIDHRIEVEPTILENNHLHFMVDFSTAMRPEFKQAIANSISEYAEGLDGGQRISITCFGRTSESWTRPGDQNPKEWLLRMTNKQFGKMDTSCLASKLEETYQSPRDENCPRQVILITNTKPLNYSDVSRVSNDARAADLQHNRTFTIGIDDVSMSLCEDIAQNTGGKAVFCSNTEMFDGYLHRQVLQASSMPSHRLSIFNATVDGQREPSNFSDTGFFTTTQQYTPIFDGRPSVDIGSNLDSGVMHIQTGFIIDDLDSERNVRLHVAIESLETGNSTTTANVSTEINEAQPPNVSLYNYVKYELDKRLRLGVTGSEQSIIDLSKTVGVLCSKTAFCGIRMSRAPEDVDDIQTPAKRARFEIDNEYYADDMHGIHMNSDNLGAFGRDAGTAQQPGRVFPEPAGNMAPEKIPTEDNTRKDLEALKTLRSITQMSGLLKQTSQANQQLTLISNDRINFEDEWPVIKKMFVEVIDKDGKLDSTVQNNYVATLLSYVVFHLFCKSPEHNTYRMNAIRSRDFAMKKLKLKNQQVEELISCMKNHFNLQASAY